MSVDVRINDQVFGRAKIVNVSGGANAESVNEYRWTFDGEGGRRLEDHVWHRYGDGAMVLAAAVLRAISARYEVAASMLDSTGRPWTADTAEAFLRGLADDQGDGLDLGSLPQVHRRLNERKLLLTASTALRVESAAAALRAAGRLP